MRERTLTRALAASANRLSIDFTIYERQEKEHSESPRNKFLNQNV